MALSTPAPASWTDAVSPTRCTFTSARWPRSSRRPPSAAWRPTRSSLAALPPGERRVRAGADAREAAGLLAEAAAASRRLAPHHGQPRAGAGSHRLPAGAVSPFGLPHPLRILADPEILAHEILSLGAGAPNAGLILKRDDLLACVQLSWCPSPRTRHLGAEGRGRQRAVDCGAPTRSQRPHLGRVRQGAPQQGIHASPR